MGALTGNPQQAPNVPRDRYEELKERVKVSGFVSLKPEEQMEYRAAKVQYAAVSAPAPDEPSSAQIGLAPITQQAVGQAIATTKPKPKPVKVEEPVMQVTKTELMEMAKKIADDAIAELRQENTELRIAEDKRRGEWEEVKDVKDENKTATLRVFRADGAADAGVIIDWKFLKNEYDENTRKYDSPVYRIKVLYDDNSTNQYDIPLLTWGEIAEIEQVEILEQKTVRQGKEHGTVKVPGRGASQSKDVGNFIKGYTQPKSLDGGIGGNYTGQTVKLMEIRDYTIVKVKRPSGQVLTLNANRLNG